MFERGISKETKGHLALLAKSNVTENFYLAGGTACALYLGHRLSFDLDFFTPKKFDHRGVRSKLEGLRNFSLEQASEGTVLGKLRNIRISFFWYRYPLLFNSQRFMEIEVADLRDIACMKLDAIGSRGTKRDFVDLYFICQKGHTLNEILGSFRNKYKDTGFSEFHLIKSLAYFVDAEAEEMPQMLVPVDWARIKSFFEDQSKKMFQKLEEGKAR